jgi:hypothetical protein
MSTLYRLCLSAFVLEVLAISPAAGQSGQSQQQLDDYLLEFYGDFANHYSQYYSQYYTFLLTHTWDIPSQFTTELNALFGGADFTSAIASDEQLATVLYDMATQFPWYNQFESTATESRPQLEVATPSVQATPTVTLAYSSTAAVSSQSSATLGITSSTTTSATVVATSKDQSSSSAQQSGESACSASAKANGTNSVYEEVRLRVIIPLIGICIGVMSILILM